MPLQATPTFDGPVTLAGSERPTTRTAAQAHSWVGRYLRASVLLDVVAALLGAAAAVVVGGRAELLLLSPRVDALIIVMSPVLWVLALAQSDAYERRQLGVGTEEFRSMPRAIVRLLAVAAVVTFVADESIPPGAGLVLAAALPVTLIASLVLRYLLRQRLHAARMHQGAAMQRAVVVGFREAVGDLVEDMLRDPSHGLHPIAACTSTPGPEIPGVALECPTDDALEVIDSLRADVVVVAHPSELSAQQLRRLSWELEERNVELMVSPGIMEVAGPRLSIRPSASLSLVHVESPRATSSARVGKVLFDRMAALALAGCALPFLGAIALAIKLDSRGPVLFRQVRVGAGGEPFQMVKFRSMVTDAEARLSEVRAEADDGNGMLYKRRDDPRVTRTGRFLRRYSLDELPQLLNVVRGDMSLVGPRPPLQSEVEKYEPDAIRRLRVRPGLTGLWQVSGRSDLAWDESLRLDLRYVDNWSMMLDLQILWRTARAVLKGQGAY